MGRAKIKRYVALCLYYGIANRLPGKGPLAEPARWIRQELCRKFLGGCGERINIGPDVYLSAGSEISIGHRSGLGRGCRVYGASDHGRGGHGGARRGLSLREPSLR